MADVNELCILILIQALAQKSVQEKESIFSVRYGWMAKPRDAKTMALWTNLSIHTSTSGQILIFQGISTKSNVCFTGEWRTYATNSVLTSLQCFERQQEFVYDGVSGLAGQEQDLQEGKHISVLG